MGNHSITDKEVQEQSNQLFSSILVSQQKFNKLAPSRPDKKKEMEKSLAEYAELKGRGQFFQYLSSGKGHGPFTQLQDESVKYDLIGGIGVGILGHSHPLIIKAHLEAATSDTVMCGNLLTYPEAIDLTKNILNQVKNSRLKHFWFSGSGSLANDSALKMIWQKSAPRYKVLAFEKAFAGRSVATQNITANPAYREGMPESLDVVHIPHYDYSNPKLALKKTIDALEKAWKEDPENYCALTIELIQGEAGFIYGDKEYYQSICQWAHKKNIYIWIDEVQTFARTTELFAFQLFELDQYVDIVTVGKALQACGTLYTNELNPKPGLIAGTFNGSIVSLNAGNKIITYLTEGKFYGENGKIHQLEKTFISKLTQLSNGSAKGKIGHIGGCGTMISFELVPSEKNITIKFIKLLFDNGIISFLAGNQPTRVRFLLPVSLTNEHIEEIFSIIESTLHDLYQDL